MSTPAERYRQYLENLSPDSLAEIGDFVAPDVHFRDPFNDVRGAEPMRRVFEHMFENVRDIRFAVRHMAMHGDTCLMHWRFEGRLRAAPWVFDGSSVIKFSADGRVSEHIDHWDAAENFYERLPVIGWLLARIRRRLSVR